MYDNNKYKDYLLSYNTMKHHIRYLSDLHLEFIKPNKNISMVQIGSSVTVMANNQEKTYLILGSSETNPQKGIISHNSPIGAALIGGKIGEKIKIKLANREIEYKIIKIE